MSVPSSPVQMIDRLKKLSADHGLSVHERAPGELAGDAEKILAKWWLGSRKVNYRMACRLSEADHTLYFREAVIEKSAGLPPPTLTVETTTTSGWQRSGQRRDISPGGQGGVLDYASFREAVQRETSAAGWDFHFEGGRFP